MSTMIDIQELTIRLADAKDHSALKRLAQRDSATTPRRSSPRRGQRARTCIAATSLADGRVIADPFRHSAGAAQLLVERARQIETIASTMTTAPRGSEVTPTAARAGGSLGKEARVDLVELREVSRSAVV